MYKMVTSKSKVIVVNPKLHNKKENSFLALPSKLDNDWLTNHKEAKVNINEVKILYVGRINPEKGILEFLKIFEEAKLNAKITLVATKGDKKMETENIKILHNLDKKSLIDTYDNHTITILPSYTEGHPQVVDESLARRRPVIIFDDISYIIKDKKGIFVSKRDSFSFSETVKYIIKDYKNIEKKIAENKLPTRKDFLLKVTDIIKNN